VITGADLIWSVDGWIGYLVLNRPELHNAISRRMWDDLPVVFNNLKSDGAKVIVITGSGSSFAAGADLLELEQLDSYESARDNWYSIRDSLNSLAGFELPTIAMINGPCLGGGCLLALSCDLRYASKTASFAVPVARLGIVLDQENIARLVDTVGPTLARELLFLGDTISGARAEASGLVNALVEPSELESTVRSAAAKIAENASVSLIHAKRSVNRALRGRQRGSGRDDRAVIESYLAQEFRTRIKGRTAR